MLLRRLLSASGATLTALFIDVHLRTFDCAPVLDCKVSFWLGGHRVAAAKALRLSEVQHLIRGASCVDDADALHLRLITVFVLDWPSKREWVPLPSFRPRRGTSVQACSTSEQQPGDVLWRHFRPIFWHPSFSNRSCNAGGAAIVYGAASSSPGRN